MKLYWHHTPFWLKWLYPGLIWKGPDSKRQVFLTFDDGPTEELTPWILKTLNDYGFKATFFCVGENLRKLPSLKKEMTDQGHCVANHTHNHKNGWNTHLNDYVDNVRECEMEIEQSPVKLFRPPYGRIKRNQVRALKENGYRIVMWDVLSGDFDTRISAEECLLESVRHTSPGSIIVFHDNVKSGRVLREVLPGYLAFLKDNQYASALWT